MSVLIVSTPEVLSTEGGTEVIFRATTPDGPVQVRFSHSMRLDGPPPPAMLGDAALALFLLPALRLRLPLEIQSPVSPVLLEALPILQEIYCCFHPDAFPAAVPVTAPTAAPSASAGGRGCFFSGGVDSFFSVLKHRESLSHLVFVHGFDLPLAKLELRREVSASVSQAASELGLPLIEVETDVRDFSDRHVHWGSHFCGAAMAAVAHLLTPWLGHVVIPATTTYAELGPFGTHLYTDERWSGDALTLVHDGMEARRIDKMRRLGTDPVALRHLRVCWQNLDGLYNCGRCEKCLRTMANLRALGVLEKSATFPGALDLARLEAMEVDHPLIIPFLDETRIEAEAAGDIALAAAIHRCQQNHRAKELARQITPLREFLPAAPEWREKAVPRFRDAILDQCLKSDADWSRRELVKHLAADPDAALALLCEHDRWWLIRQVLKAKLVPRWLRRRS